MSLSYPDNLTSAELCPYRIPIIFIGLKRLLSNEFTRNFFGEGYRSDPESSHHPFTSPSSKFLRRSARYLLPPVVASKRSHSN